ncbi:MAG TPA: lytic transglycosylase domain-containing protein, partial [Bradyrhizobium sp.]
APIIAGKQTDGKTVTAAKSSASTSSPLFVVRTASHSSGDRSSYDLHPDHATRHRAAVDLSALVPLSGGLFVHHASEVRSP